MPLFEPTGVIGSGKYGNKGMFTTDSFKNINIPTADKKLLEHAVNHSLSSRTWSSYRTVGNLLELCQTETRKILSLPLDEDKTLIFIAWLIKRGLKARSINSYLSGLRMLHLSKGETPPILRSDLVKQVIEGRVHIDFINDRILGKPKRLPVTPTILKLIKLELKDSNLSKETKRLLWVVSTLAFAGGFRVGELLARVESTFDPLYTLLGQDIKIISLKLGTEQVETLQVKIKSQKTDRIGVECLVDVYESKGPLCPVQAFKKWRKSSSSYSPNKPAFRDDSGRPLTSKKFNKHLKSLLEGHIDYNVGKISSHSFRAGIATLLGQLGFSDEQIKAHGRWSSKAFESYLKLPRTKRVDMARRIGDLNL